MVIDRIDFVPDLSNGGSRLPFQFFEQGRIIPMEQSQATARRPFFMFEGVNGIRMEGRPLDEYDIHRVGESRDPSRFCLSRIIINPTAFPSLLHLKEHWDYLFAQLGPTELVRHSGWHVRIQRIELAVDLAVETEDAMRDVYVRYGDRKHFQLHWGTNVLETVYGGSPSRLAIYNRRSALERFRRPVPDHPLTRFERRYTKPSSWTSPNAHPNREIQSIDWIINMCADIDEGLLLPFNGVRLMRFNNVQSTPEIDALYRRVLRAVLRKPQRREALMAYREELTLFTTLKTIALQQGYNDARHYIIDNYGQRHFRGNLPTARHMRRLLGNLFPNHQQVDFGEELRQSIRRHHFNGQAPQRLHIPHVGNRNWDEEY